jgi:pSer/pThr/pTyr-binding forkhead associated (FHA) protein
MGKWSLVIEDDVGQQREFPFSREVVTIGRKEGNTVRLTDRNVSRFHAKFTREADVVHVEDLQSFNGVRINGSRMQGKVAVHAGDIVQIGDYVLQLRAAEMQQPVPASLHDAADHDEDDEFAGETQRWQPPESAPTQDLSLPRGIAHGGFGDDSGDTQRMTVESTRRSEAPTQEPQRADLHPENSTSVSTPMPAPRLTEMATARVPVGDFSTAPLVVAEETGRITLPMGQDLGTPRLVAINTIFCGVSFPLRKAETIIGRDADNDIVIQHASVSRNHVKLTIDNGKVRVHDLGGANGTLVNDQEVEETALQAGDVLELGRVKLRFAPIGDAFAMSSSEIEAARRQETIGEVTAQVSTAPSVLDEEHPKRKIWPWAAALAVAAVAGILLAINVFGDETKVVEAVPTPIMPTPIVPTPIVPTPIVPTPIVPTPVVPTPVVPTPIVPTPVVPTPIVPTPVVPTPVVPVNADSKGKKPSQKTPAKYDDTELATIRRDAAAYRVKSQNAAAAEEWGKLVRSKQATSNDVYQHGVCLLGSEDAVQGCRQLKVAISMTGLSDTYREHAQQLLASKDCNR